MHLLNMHNYHLEDLKTPSIEREGDLSMGTNSYKQNEECPALLIISSTASK